MSASRFFFYGTLADPRTNAFSASLHRKLEPGRPAWVKGRLLRVRHCGEWHRALVLDDTGRVVRGMAFDTTEAFGPADLALLDEYEGIDASSPETADYRRVAAVAETGDDRLAVQTCVWNGPTPDAASEIET